ncbi:beta-lactamase family protein [Nocardiopsis sp. CNT-189]|uniref:serine hydrolase domain-containing protein n=1 Tax=Nocardiopsis oceanisediminis TaxID=2816862 RepID=UPI003B37B372
MNPTETIGTSPPPGPARRRRLRTPLAAAAAFAAVAVLAAGCAGGAADPVRNPPPTLAETAGLTAQDVDAWLDGLVPDALARTGVPGAAVSVVHDGEILTARGFGLADTGADGGDPVPVDADETLFRPGSVSKVVTATAVMRLVQDGEVDLDTDIAEYLDFEPPSSFEEPVTIRHLLSHTAGYEERYGGGISGEGKVPDLGEYVKNDAPEQVYEPGTMPAYSNYGITLAGYIVERVGGVPFEEYLEQNVFEPLGMDSSTFAQPVPGELEGRLAKGYMTDTEPSRPFEVVADAPAGSMSTSATDMARFMLGHLGEAGDRSPLSTETLRLMHAPALGEEELGGLAAGPRMALGLFEQDRNGRRIVGHGGDTALFHAHMQLYPDEGTGVFVALNGTGEGDDVRQSILDGFTDRYFPDEGKDGTGVQPTAAEHAAMAEGTYEVSRMPWSTFMTITGPLMGQTRVTAQEDGTLLFAPWPYTGRPTLFEEVEPWVWREVDGRTRVAMRVEGGRVEAINLDAAITLQAVDGMRDADTARPVLLASAAVLLTVLASVPAGALLRRLTGRPRRDPAGRTARVLTRMGAACALASLAGWGIVFTRIMEFQAVGQGTLYMLLLGQLLGAAAIAPAAVVLFEAVRRRAGWKRCLGAVLVLSALIGVAAFAAVFNLFSFDLSY